MTEETDKISRAIEEENRLASVILDRLADGLVIMDMELHILQFNKAAMDMWGYPENDVIGQSSLNFLSKADLPEISKVLQEVITQKDTVRNINVTGIRKSGEIFPINCNISLLTDNQGRPEKIITLLHDDTEHKQTEKALRDSETRYKTLFSTAVEGILVADVRAKKFLYCNQAICKMLGYTEEELMHLNVGDIHPKETLGYVMAEFEAEVRGEKKFTELPCLRKDGTIFQASIGVSGITIDGHEGLLGFFTDITERKQAQEMLQNSEARLHTLVQTIPDLIWLKDTNGVYLSCNIMFERFVGRKEADIVGKTDYDLVSRELADSFRENDRKAMAAGKPTSNEEWVVFADDGHRASLDTIKTPMYDAKGTLIGVLGIGRDITERKLAEENLREKTAFLEAQINASIDGILVVDDNQKKILANRRIADLFSIPQNIVEDEDDTKQLAHVMGLAKYPEKFLERVTYLYNHPDEIGREEIEFSNGMILDRYSAPVLGKDGQYYGRIWTFRDITARKQAEEEMHFIKTKLELSLQSSQMGVWQYNIVENKRIYDNQACSLLGITPATFGGTAEEFFAVVHSDDREKIKAALKQTIEQNVPYEPEYRAVWPDGSIHYISARGKLICDDNGKPQAINGIIWDITARKQVEDEVKKLNEELEDANQELKNFVYIASHDLREPLRKISAFGDILQKNIKGKITGDDAECLSFMIDGAVRMSKMIEGLLTYSRVSTNVHSAETVNLNEIVEQLRQLELSVLLEEKHTTIDIPQPLPEVEVDPVQIRQLMQNLIANGMKYQAKGNVPHITITSRPDAEDMVRINITDNGIGIAPEFHQAIFVMFKRLHRKDEYEGTGIGLAVCKKIVERNGGQIGVESEMGNGSTFWFTVPAVKVAQHLDKIFKVKV